MIELICQWRNDAERDLEERAKHLLAKTAGPHGLLWLWVVGDSEDATEEELNRIARRARRAGQMVRVLRRDTGVEGEDTETRRKRTSKSGSLMFAEISPRADFVCLHESDLRTSEDVIEKLLAANSAEPVCGWPVIDLPSGRQFYDVWAYRDLKGRHFEPHLPYARGYRKDRPFEVGSFGSVFLAPAGLVRGREMQTRGLVDLCEQWRSEGVRLWCDPSIVVEQPVSLWEAA